MEPTMIILAVFGLCALIYAIVLQIKVSEQKKSINDMDKLNQQRMKEAQEQIAIQKKEALLFAKETLHEQREEFEREIKSRRNEIIKLEDKLAQREDKIESKIQELTDKEEARNILLQQIDKDLTHEYAVKIKENEEINDVVNDEDIQK